jgi:type II restriction enzyme
MNLSMTGELATALKSSSQSARVVTEAWGAENFYCPNCSSPRLDWLKNDYRCPNCGFWFQLKSRKSRLGNFIRGGAYDAMMEAIKNDCSPNFFFLHYDLATLTVKNLLLVPHFAYSPSAIVKHKPFRRAGRIDCNFDLNRIPADARIPIVTTIKPRHRGDTECIMISKPEEVREKFKRVKPLKEISTKQRHWTLDVLNLVRRLDKPEFSNKDVYAFARELEKLHSDNRHVCDKIRRQLHILRDAKLLIDVSNGIWRLP